MDIGNVHASMTFLSSHYNTYTEVLSVGATPRPAEQLKTEVFIAIAMTSCATLVPSHSSPTSISTPSPGTRH